MSSYPYLNLYDTAAQLRAKKTSVQEIVRGCLERIAKLDKKLNAVIALDPKVEEKARELDAELDKGKDRGLLHGIPLLVKDNIDVAGLPTTAASPLFTDVAPAKEDAVVIAGLRKAGAIILGKTNMDELAAHVSGRTSCRGATLNPWQPARKCSPGGSSSGSAASVAAGFCVAALGTDTGGSIRLPAGWCGLFGLRPSWGLLSAKGIYPRAVSMDTAGILTRSAADMLPLLKAMLEGEPPAVSLPDKPCIAVMSRLVRSLAGSNSAIVDRYESSVANWKELGCQIVEVEFPLLIDAEVANVVDTIRSFEFYRDIHMDVEKNPAKERMHAVPSADYAAGKDTSLEKISAAKQKRQEYTETVQAFFAKQGLDGLLLPTAFMTAPRLDAPAEEYKNARLLMNLFSITGNPTFVYPGGCINAMPSGMQLVGRVRADALLLALGEAYERRFHPFQAVDTSVLTED